METIRESGHEQYMKSSMIPWEIVVDNRIITDKFKVLEKWKMDFELLLNPSGGDDLTNTDTHDELNDTDNSMLILRITCHLPECKIIRTLKML